MNPQPPQAPYPPTSGTQAPQQFPPGGRIQRRRLPMSFDEMVIIFLRLCALGTVVVGFIWAAKIVEAIPPYAGPPTTTAGYFGAAFTFFQAVVIAAFIYVFTGIAKNLLEIRDSIPFERT